MFPLKSLINLKIGEDKKGKFHIIPHPQNQEEEISRNKNLELITEYKMDIKKITSKEFFISNGRTIARGTVLRFQKRKAPPKIASGHKIIIEEFI
jgi:hypothetical protein